MLGEGAGALPATGGRETRDSSSRARSGSRCERSDEGGDEPPLGLIQGVESRCASTSSAGNGVPGLHATCSPAGFPIGIQARYMHETG